MGGFSNGSSMSQVFAMTHPDRVAAEAEAILPGEAGGDVERDYGAQEGQTPARREQ